PPPPPQFFNDTATTDFYTALFWSAASFFFKRQRYYGLRGYTNGSSKGGEHTGLGGQSKREGIKFLLGG
ncbi:hypothetical protein ACVGW6_20885, partial [Enterobacter intestinihominis]